MVVDVEGEVWLGPDLEGRAVPAVADGPGPIAGGPPVIHGAGSVCQAWIGSDLEADSTFASSLRELMRSFWNTLRRWYSTVRGLR